MDLLRMHITITGRVQGVWFRAHTRRTANALRLTGWVRNMRDGSVEAEAQGPADNVRELVSWCRRGSPSARVDDVQTEAMALCGGEQDFVVHR